MIVVFDLDGTISFNGTSIERTLIKSIKDLEMKGNQIIFASARPIRDMYPLLKADFEDNFYIGGNGSIIKEGNTIKISRKIDPFSVDYLKNMVEEYHLDYLVDDEWNYSLKNGNDKLAQINEKVDAQNLAENISIENIQNPIKFVLLNIPTNKFETIYQRVKKLSVEIVKHEGTNSIDITAQNVNKYTTFRKYFPDAEYIAFGNDENDVTLLENSKIAVVVGKKLVINKKDYARVASESSEVAEIIDKYGNYNLD